MKELRCNKCNACLGEIIKGKIKKTAVLFCKECASIDKAYKDYNNNGFGVDFLKDVFGKSITYINY